MLMLPWCNATMMQYATMMPCYHLDPKFGTGVQIASKMIEWARQVNRHPYCGVLCANCRFLNLGPKGPWTQNLAPGSKSPKTCLLGSRRVCRHPYCRGLKQKKTKWPPQTLGVLSVLGVQSQLKMSNPDCWWPGESIDTHIVGVWNKNDQVTSANPRCPQCPRGPESA
jgi:hypothetical protein